jgi:hypothetical protein
VTDPVAGPVTSDADMLYQVVAALDPADDIHAMGEYRRRLAATPGTATSEVIP